MIPARLAAPAPGWTSAADVVVVGSGVAGLTAALHAHAAGLRVLLVTKAFLESGSTRWAQGGIAAALGADDSPDDHLRDTLVAGVGLCDTDAVRVLVDEGPGRVRELIGFGARFDTDAAGHLELTREGGHLRRRIAHAGGDATGAEIERALVAAVKAAPGIELIEHALVLDLLYDAQRRAAGVTLHVLGEGSRDGVGAALAPAVVLATGGMGQIYAATTNPDVSTGDGVALALRAGADVADLEFVQFHPTALWTADGRGGQRPLVTEALRGEGAVIVDADGHRVLAGRHELEDLAPRDVVTKVMSRRMAELGVDHLFLDARALGADLLRHRFPTLVANCRDIGVDPALDLVPVAPAAHYASGGVRTDLSGRTSVPGLYACGETACTGVHGANRLASNSLLEGLVFSARIAADVAADRERHGGAVPGEPVAAPAGSALLPATARQEVAAAMTEGAGVLRSGASLDATSKTLATIGEQRSDAPGPEAWEATNLQLVANALVAAARQREETRGSHWREDFPDADERWRLHLVSRLVDGRVETRAEPVR